MESMPIKVKNLSKVFRIYNKPTDRLKELFVTGINPDFGCS